MSEIRVTNVIGENGSSPVNFTQGINMSGIVTATSFVPTVGQLSHRNLIINGDMRIAQRGTSSTSSGYYTVDRFNNFFTGTDESPTQAQVDVASGTTPYTLGFRKALRITNGNQTSGAGASDFISIQYKFEAQDIANSGWNYTSASSFITLSFWIKSSVAQTFKGYIRSLDGTEQNYPFETGSLTADTWTKITKTISGNSNLTFNNDNGEGLQITIAAFWGTDYTDSSVTENAWAAYSGSTRMKDNTSTWYTTNDATLELTGFQLEVGSVATPFEHRSFADELKRCQRYYYTSSRWMGGSRGSGTARSFVTDFGMRLTGSQVSGGTYTNEATSGGDVVYIGTNATRQNSDVNANSLGASSTSSNGSLQLSVTVGYALGSGDNGIATGLFINGFTVDHEL